ncbi:recombination-associated protein RdgC [Neisseria sp. ZJ106]|uniref:Recombination-associated protein RdgC n=1 Tax=Neisseria lisongii TaxID=2912188 RepID=A0AAW5AN14_9NEIS|nr:recombination-associated protein RdgC [Neisseria lisongii]MCF7521144.1 recombination-associated protein RdgC [Neisseria lisongii]MCF7528833.1 recombination-associated protein RdgC [Neisseria lisongii]WCL72067.1 recombination-associated protein RdgC [Neisseria lisongii]
MWFKQISFYPLNREKLPDLELLADKLAAAEFVPCQGLDWFSEGFAAPVAFSPEAVFPADYTWRVALKKEEKVLPAGVIRDILDEKVLEIQNNEGRNVGRKEKQELKDIITDDLLPRAFTRSSRVQAVFDTRRGFLLVNHAAQSKAENVLTKLREALGGLEAALPQTKQSPSSLMTSWLLNGGCEGGFELDSDCELKGSGDVAPTVKISKQDLTADEVVQHVKNGKTVTQLGLVWRDQIAFVLTQDFTLKRIQYLDVLQEEAESSGDDAASLMFASQILMTEALGSMLEELVSLLGGWQA